MMTDVHDHNDCRISFLSRLVSVVSQMSFNSWDIHLARTEEIRVSGMSVLFHIYYPGRRSKGKAMHCV